MKYQPDYDPKLWKSSVLEQPLTPKHEQALNDFTPGHALLLCKNILTLEQKNTVINIHGESLLYVSLGEIINTVLSNIK